jgi:hypothetical protein
MKLSRCPCVHFQAFRYAVAPLRKLFMLPIIPCVQLIHALGDGVLVAFPPRFLLDLFKDPPSFNEVFGVTFRALTTLDWLSTSS